MGADSAPMQHIPSPTIDRPAARPALRRGVPVIWRSATSLQIGVTPHLRLSFPTTEEACVIARFLDSLDGSRTWAQLLEHDELLIRLCQRGLIDDAATDQPPMRSDARARVAAEDAAIATAWNQPSEPRRILQRRAAAVVHVRGDGRIGAAIGALLASAGIGRVVINAEPGSTGRELVTEFDVSPWGPRADELGTSRLAAVRAAVQRATIMNAPQHDEPALVILAKDCVTSLPWIEPEWCDDLMSESRAHMTVASAGIRGRISGIIRQGVACQRCVALARVDADPEWPMIAAHLIRPRRNGTPPSSLSTVAFLAALATEDALAFIDSAVQRDHALLVERTSVSEEPVAAHPRCGCTWRLPHLRAVS